MSEQEKLERITKIVTEFAAGLYRDRSWQIEQMRLGVQVPHATGEQLLQSGEAQEWLHMAKAAVGLVERTGDSASYVYEICQSLAEWLFSFPDIAAYPGDNMRWWWSNTEMGALHAQAMLWLKGDELIALAQAAELCDRPSVQSISQAVKRGTLTGYIDPLANERQGRTLISRAEFEDWRRGRGWEG
jgi:hypothetical protein